MKLYLPILAGALLLAGSPVTTQAGDLKPVYNSKGQLIAVVPAQKETGATAVQSDSGPAHYVASSSGKGGAVTRSPLAGGETAIAVFKSKKHGSCCQH